MRSGKDEPPFMQDLDQRTAEFAETMPPMWRRVFENLVAQGFNDEQALKIIMAMVHGAFGGKLLA